jgi:hypothetical protein
MEMTMEQERTWERVGAIIVAAGDLLKELPALSVVFREAGGKSWTAEEMIGELEQRSAVGLNYAYDLFVVARDLLARQAR